MKRKIHTEGLSLISKCWNWRPSGGQTCIHYSLLMPYRFKKKKGSNHRCMIKLFHDKVFCSTESLINVYINMHPIFPFIIDVSRVYSDYSDQVFGLKHCEQCLFKFHSESFSQIWFCLIRIAKNENIWFIITSHSSSCNVLPPSPHSISDKHRPRCGLTQVVVLWDQWQPSKTIKSRIKLELMKFPSVFCHRCASLLRLTHWYTCLLRHVSNTTGCQCVLTFQQP